MLDIQKVESVKKALANGTGQLLVWLFRMFVIGIIFWLRSEFVSKEKYLEDQGKQIEQWTKLTATLTHIDDVLVTLDKHDDDQEKRLRSIETKK